MNAAWIGLIGALGGVLLTGLIGLATAALTHVWQRDTRQQERLDHLNEARAELRRDAYTRFLVASDALWESVLAQEIHEYDVSGSADLYQRLRTLGTSGGKHFDEFDASYLQVKLLCGVGVEDELAGFHEWFVAQLATALQESDILSSPVLRGLEDARQPLIAAMKAEQRSDLGFAPD